MALIALPFGNTYLYVSGNPVNRVDPTGAVTAADVAGLAAGVIVGGVVTIVTGGLGAGTGASVAAGGCAGGATQALASGGSAGDVALGCVGGALI